MYKPTQFPLTWGRFPLHFPLEMDIEGLVLKRDIKNTSCCTISSYILQKCPGGAAKGPDEWLWNTYGPNRLRYRYGSSHSQQCCSVFQFVIIWGTGQIMTSFWVPEVVTALKEGPNVSRNCTMNIYFPASKISFLFFRLFIEKRPSQRTLVPVHPYVHDRGWGMAPV